MQIGIIGSGDVAKVLAEGFLKYGHNAMISSREPEKLSAWAKENQSCRIGTFAEAAKFGELVVLSVKGKYAMDALHMAGASNLNGKPVIDVTNPISDAAPVNGVIKYFTSLDESLMERFQSDFKNVHFVKAFNSVGRAFMVNPQFKGGKPTMFICGNEDSAKKVVTGILDQFGWEVADMGMVESARAIEPLCMLWCIPGLLRNEWNHSFKLLK